jgi:hypothetical protein
MTNSWEKFVDLIVIDVYSEKQKTTFIYSFEYIFFFIKILTLKKKTFVWRSEPKKHNEILKLKKKQQQIISGMKLIWHAIWKSQWDIQ